MKRIGVLIAVCSLFALALCCSLGLTAYADGNVIVAASYDPPQAGQTVTVTVNFSGNTGFNTMGIALTYPEGFTYQSATASPLVRSNCYLNVLRSGSSNNATYIFKNYPSSNCLKFIMVSQDDISLQTGTLFTATFTAPQTLPADPAFTVGIVKEGVLDAAGAAVTLLGSSEELTVFRMGDVNKDGNINLSDILLILDHRAGAAALDSEQLTLADVSYDGSVNLSDILRILDFRAGVIDTLEEIEGDGLFEYTNIGRPTDASVAYLTQFGCLAGIARFES